MLSTITKSNKINVLSIENDLEKEFEEDDFRNKRKGNRLKLAGEMVAYSSIMQVKDDIGISGVKHCCNASVPYFRRILWILVILGGLSVMTWQMADRINYYFSYDMNVITEIIYVDELDFPAITVCNHNSFKRSEVEADGYGELLTDIYYYRHPNFTSFNFTDFNSTEFFINYAQPLSDLYYVVFWQGSNAVYVENFTITLSKFGVCFTFNEDGNYKSSSTGATSGLSMYLFIRDHESFAGKRVSSGFQVLAHPPGIVPLMTELGYSAPVGFSTRIGLRAQEIKNIKPPWGICDDSKELEFFESYSYEACRLECETSYIVSQCGCRMYYMPGNATPCDLQEMFYCGSAYEWYYPGSEESQDCDCPVPCQKLVYNPTISQATLPSSYASYHYSNAFGVTEDYLKENYVEIDIYFEELNIEKISQKPSYDVFDLFCDIGGSVGLWVGGSILTLYEIIDIIVNVSFLSCNQR